MTRFAMLAVVILLSACGGAKTDERDAAAGNILPGSASDAMLQTDHLQSEAPLAAPEVADEDAAPGDKGAVPEKADESGEADATDAEPSAAPPAAPPAPAPATPTL